MRALDRETFEQFYRDALPLLERHRQEIAHFDFPLDVDTQMYRTAEQNGGLRIYTTRINGRLIGYAVFFVRTNPHYRSSLQAVEDVLFIVPEERKGRLGLELVQYAEEQLKGEGVQAVYHHCKLAHPQLARLLEHEGYSEIERIFVKRVG